MLKGLTYDDIRAICSKNGELSMTINNDESFASDHNHLKLFILPIAMLRQNVVLVFVTITQFT